MDCSGYNKQNLTHDLNGDMYTINKLEDVSSDGHKILFTYEVYDPANRNTTYTTYCMDINGNNKKNLANSDLRPFHPKFSYDRQYIVFDATEPVDDIYIMDMDQSEVRNLTNDSDRDWLPQFTPQGDKIIYVSEKENSTDIYSINFDGTNITNLSNAVKPYGTYYCLSTDGSKIAYSSYRDGQIDIYIMNCDGTHQQRLTTSGGNEGPIFSSDNSKVACISWSISGYDIKLIDINSKDEKTLQLITRPQSDYWRPTMRFSPDDSYILYTSYVEGNSEIYLSDLNGNNPINITNNPGGDYLGIVVPNY
jgi:TolB protein